MHIPSVDSLLTIFLCEDYYLGADEERWQSLGACPGFFLKIFDGGDSKILVPVGGGNSKILVPVGPQWGQSRMGGLAKKI